MITPNMDALSLVELQYIAQKQGVEGSDEMDREDLIELLEEMFEDNGSGNRGEASNYAPSNQKRFFNSLVEHENFGPLPLPGVEELPEAYAQTAIHLMLKDPFWAHAYWDINSPEIMKYDQNGQTYTLLLRVTMLEREFGSEDGDTYEIQVKKTDSNWNVNLPIRGRTYKVTLLYRRDNGEEGFLCQSNTVTSPDCLWITRGNQLNSDERTFNLLFSSIMTKGGVVLDCPLIQEVVSAIDKSGRSS